MSEPSQSRPARKDPQVRRVRGTWWLLAGSFFVLGLLVVVRLGTDPVRPVDAVFAGLVVLVGLAAVLHRDAVGTLEVSRRAEAESIARILQGLSRSVSPEAIVDAIVEELANGTGADHVVVVRLRPEGNALEATLVSSGTGAPSTTTLFPTSDLEDATDEPRRLPGPAPAPIGGEQLALDLASAAGWRDGSGSARGGRLAGLRVRAGSAGDRIANRIAARAGAAYGLSHTIAAPLWTGDRVIGAIVLSRRTSQPWPAASHRILGGAAVEASAALSRAFSHLDAEARASTDGLTGLPNRRYFEDFCSLLARRRRVDDVVGVLMVDIDRFKRVNDGHGHAVGDVVLRAVAGAIAGAVRDDDVPARFGGEEFAVLLRNPSPEVALDVAERIRQSVARLDLRRYRIERVTVSVGVAVADRPDQPIADLLDRADRALYDAKRAGRDRVKAA